MIFMSTGIASSPGQRPRQRGGVFKASGSATCCQCSPKISRIRPCWFGAHSGEEEMLTGVSFCCRALNYEKKFDMDQSIRLQP